jgi:hypothetical protein
MLSDLRLERRGGVDIHQTEPIKGLHQLGLGLQLRRQTVW